MSTCSACVATISNRVNVSPHVTKNGFREIFAFGIRIPINFCLQNLGSSTLESGIQVPLTKNAKSILRIRNPGQESRIQDSPWDEVGILFICSRPSLMKTSDRILYTLTSTLSVGLNNSTTASVAYFCWVSLTVPLTYSFSISPSTILPKYSEPSIRRMVLFSIGVFRKLKLWVGE